MIILFLLVIFIITFVYSYHCITLTVITAHIKVSLLNMLWP